MVPKVTDGSLEQIRAYVASNEGQETISDFIDGLRKKSGSQDGYMKLCKEAEEDSGKFLSSEVFLGILEKFDRFIKETPPGHDQNHLHRDFLAAFVLINDPYAAKAFYHSDLIAGILAGGFHDIGNAVVHRYRDNEGKVGHAEVGAWLFFLLTADMVVSEPLRTLAAYAIVCHTQYLKPVPVKNPSGFIRQPYWNGLWEEDGKPVGLAIQITRFVDRLENNGVTHFARHLLATADAFESGGGENISGNEFYSMNAKALDILLSTEVRENPPNPRSVLEHMATYNASNFHCSPYSLVDHLFPTLTQLMLTKVFQTRVLTGVVTRPAADVDIAHFDELTSLALFKDTLRQISQSPRFEGAWRILEMVWGKLTAEQKARWVAGLEFVRKDYISWLKELAKLALKKSSDSVVDYQAVVNEIVELCI